MSTDTTTDKQVWYALEVSANGADDWFAVTGNTADDEKTITAYLTVKRHEAVPGFEYRAVRKTLVTETI